MSVDSPRPIVRAGAALLCSALLAALLGLAPGSPLAPGPAAAAEAWQHEMLAQLNAYRAAHGRAPVTMCASLNQVATAHSRDMANRGVLTHTSWDGTTFDQRIARSSYGSFTSAAENVAVGQSSVSQVMQGWRNSGPHNANLLASHVRHVGFGKVTGSYSGHGGMPYWTQDFASGGYCTPAPPAVNHPFGAFESATSPAKGKLRVTGWAIDRDAGTASIPVHVYVNGNGHNLGKASRSRPDVAAAHGLGAAHGFDTTLTVSPGNKHVCAYAINTGGGANQQLGCRTVWVADPASPFTDLLSTNPFFDDIVWMRNAGITTGNPDGTFGITEPTTRQAMAAFLHRIAGSPQGPFPDPRFSDVGPNHPFRLQIAWMAHTGITTGNPDGSFGAGDPVSRQATVAFIHRMAGEPPARAGAPGFRDVPAGHPFRASIRWAAGDGIVTGWTDGTFRPGQLVSRQAIAAFLHRWRS